MELINKWICFDSLNWMQRNQPDPNFNEALYQVFFKPSQIIKVHKSAKLLKCGFGLLKHLQQQLRFFVLNQFRRLEYGTSAFMFIFYIEGFGLRGKNFPDLIIMF